MSLRTIAILGLLTTGAFAASLGDNRLLDAVKSSNLAGVKAALAQGAKVEAADPDGSTALHWAAQRNSDEIAAALLAAGAKPDAKTRFNMTPIGMAAMNGNAKLIARLLDAGVDANGTINEGQTILMTAALQGNPDAVKLLIQRGAKVNAIEPYKNQTAMMFAAG